MHLFHSVFSLRKAPFYLSTAKSVLASAYDESGSERSLQETKCRTHDRPFFSSFIEGDGSRYGSPVRRRLVRRPSSSFSSALLRLFLPIVPTSSSYLLSQPTTRDQRFPPGTLKHQQSGEGVLVFIVTRPIRGSSCLHLPAPTCRGTATPFVWPVFSCFVFGSGSADTASS